MNKNIVLAFTLFVLLLTSCSAPSQVETDDGYIFGDSQPQAWIDAPLNESYLPLDPYEIVYHISDQQGVSLGELSINNQVIESLPNPDTSKKLATLNYFWNPTEPGTYLISVRAQGTDGTWGGDFQSVVYIGEIVETILPTLEVTATPISTATVQAGFANFSTSPNAIHFGSCTPNQVYVSASAIDPAGISFVGIFYRMRDTNGEYTEWSNMAMNPGENDLYFKTIDLTIFSSPFTSGVLDIQMVIQNNNGDLVRSDVYSEVGISSCNRPLFELDFSNFQFPQLSPSSTPLPPTSTPVPVY